MVAAPVRVCDRTRLHGGDGPLLGGSDALLQRAQVGRQRGLVAHGRGDAPQQRRYLRVGLWEAACRTR